MHLLTKPDMVTYPKLEELVGKFYNCIFGEEKGQYDKNRPHKHKVVNAWAIHQKDSILDGIAFETETGAIISGCDRKHFSNT